MSVEHVKRHRGLRIAGAVAIGLVAVPLFGALVMLLWNWLVPPIFGWSAIGFWQALGLLLLCRILVGGFHGGPNSHSDWRHRMIHRWERMTPEEREKLRAAMRAHGCGPEAAEGQSRA